MGLLSHNAGFHQIWMLQNWLKMFSSPKFVLHIFLDSFYLYITLSFGDYFSYAITGSNQCNPNKREWHGEHQFPCEIGYENRMCAKCSSGYLITVPHTHIFDKLGIMLMEGVATNARVIFNGLYPYCIFWPGFFFCFF